MCNVKLNIENEKDINFAVYNMILSKKHDEFSVEDIVKDLQIYIKKDPTWIENRVKKLFQVWSKNGMLEEHINTFVRV